MDLEDEELDLLETAQNTGKVTEKHAKKIQSRCARWFSTLEEHGGTLLKELLIVEPANYAQGRVNGYCFFNMVGGSCDTFKHTILNHCLVLCGMKWLCLSGANKGKPLLPKSFCRYMGLIFAEFRKKGFEYDFRRDFDEKGDFHGVMIKRWETIRKQDPTYGVPKPHSDIDWELDRKVREAVNDGRLKPWDDPHHLQLVTCYVLGRFFLFRGCKEMCDLLHQQLYQGIYTRKHGDLAGMEYYAVEFPEDKTNRLSLVNPGALKDEERVIKVMEIRAIFFAQCASWSSINRSVIRK